MSTTGERRAGTMLRVLSVALAAVVLSLIAIPPGASHADAPYVAGDWDVTLRVMIPDFESSTYCATFIWQDGDSLDAAMACPSLGEVLGAGTFQGTIAEDGTFAISGIIHLIPNTDLNGTLSADGQSLSGTWNFGVWEAVRSDVSHWGDVDCRDLARSTDALIVLQREAKLLTVRPACLPYADGDVDGDVDATDALVILQDEAGLLDRLPVGPGEPPPVL